MRFSTPIALLLLLTLPYFVWLAGARLAGRHWRDRASIGIRLLILFLLTLSLAGAQIVRAAEELAVVFLVDASDSIGAEQMEAAESYVREAVSGMGREDRTAVVLFGANALVERPMSGLTELAPFSSAPLRLQTDLADAIRLGMALFPAGSARRLVVLSDGAATSGDTMQAAQLAAAAGIEIDYVPLTRPAGSAEVMLTQVDAPTRVRQGEQFTLVAGAFSTVNTEATLRVLGGDGRVVYEEQVTLNRGSNNFPITLRGGEQEFLRYTVELEPAVDTYYQNNRLAAFSEVTGPPRVLLVSSEGELDDNGEPYPPEARQLREALQATGLIVEQMTPAQLPSALPALGSYASVVLVNVNAKNLSPRKMAALQSYVRDLGGGLVVVGGPQSYGMGGYFRTPLEETLPVEMQIKDQERFPAVTIVIVIDRSGSMAMQEGGLTKIQLADEAAVRVVELLNPFDEIAVIPVDTVPDQVIGPALASDREEIIGQIRQIGAGGGGINVRTGVAAAVDVLAASENEVKHLIVLADGSDSNEQEGAGADRGLVAGGATVSMVAIGDGKDVPWLQQMAELGNGRFHLTQEAANLPQIFTQETTSIQRTYLVEERFFPTLRSNSPIVANITQVPPLYGLSDNRQSHGADSTGNAHGRPAAGDVAVRSGPGRRLDIGCDRPLGNRLGALGRLPHLLGTGRFLVHHPEPREQRGDRRRLWRGSSPADCRCPERRWRLPQRPGSSSQRGQPGRRSDRRGAESGRAGTLRRDVHARSRRRLSSAHYGHAGGSGRPGGRPDQRLGARLLAGVPAAGARFAAPGDGRLGDRGKQHRRGAGSGFCPYACRRTGNATYLALVDPAGGVSAPGGHSPAPAGRHAP